MGRQKCSQSVRTRSGLLPRGQQGRIDAREEKATRSLCDGPPPAYVVEGEADRHRQVWVEVNSAWAWAGVRRRDGGVATEPSPPSSLKTDSTASATARPITPHAKKISRRVAGAFERERVQPADRLVVVRGTWREGMRRTSQFHKTGGNRPKTTGTSQTDPTR